MVVAERRVRGRVSRRTRTRSRSRNVIFMAVESISTRKAGVDRLSAEEGRAYDFVEEYSGLGPEGTVFSRIIDAAGDSRKESARETSLGETQSVEGRGVVRAISSQGRSIGGRHVTWNRGDPLQKETLERGMTG
jgi:hypothetical protein